MPVLLNDLLESTAELAALPATTIRLLDLLDDAAIDADSVLTIIERDPALVANLLKLCNSAYYGGSRDVGTTREALVLLGNQTVVTLAFATSMGKVLRGPLTGYRRGRDELWYHAVGTSLAARTIAESMYGVESRERAFIGGLLHDIGKQLLNRALLQAVQQVPPEYTSEELLQTERSILGCDHAEAGAMLAERWHFPPDLVAAIADHHSPSAAGPHEDIVRVVWAANLLAAGIGTSSYSGSEIEPELRTTLLEQGIPESIPDQLGIDLKSRVEDFIAVVGESL